MPLLHKPEVNTQALEHPFSYVCVAIGAAVALLATKGIKNVITSLNDGQHMQGSLHYADKAVDLRTRDLRQADAQWLFINLKDILDPCGYDVVLEKDHIHVEFDPKAGEKFLETCA